MIIIITNNNCDVYGAIIMTTSIARVHLMNTDLVQGGRQPSDQANQL